MIYLIGSLRQSRVRCVAHQLREAGYGVFDDWHGVGPHADEHWQHYETERGRTYREALYSPLAGHAFNFDRENIEASDTGVLVLPAGKSGHLELGHFIFTPNKRGYILLDGEPERWDLMYRFAHGIFYTFEELLKGLQQ